MPDYTVDNECGAASIDDVDVVALLERIAGLCRSYQRHAAEPADATWEDDLVLLAELVHYQPPRGGFAGCHAALVWRPTGKVGLDLVAGDPREVAERLAAGFEGPDVSLFTRAAETHEQA